MAQATAPLLDSTSHAQSAKIWPSSPRWAFSTQISLSRGTACQFRQLLTVMRTFKVQLEYLIAKGAMRCPA